MKDYPKILIVDYDHTLAIPEGRDWENAKPNLPLIQELNRLYDIGYEIHIYTARGHLSCNSREEAERNNGQQIRHWLSKYHVRYNILSFNKPLGIYYIDDKSLRPNEINKLKELT